MRGLKTSPISTNMTHRENRSSRAVFYDTSAFMVLANSKDQHHREAIAIQNAIELQGFPPVTSNLVVIEAHALMIIRMGAGTARQWLLDFSSPILWVEPEDYQGAISVIRKYKEASFSLCDACSFVLIERLKLPYVFAFDEHFPEYGFMVLRSDQPFVKNT